MNLAAESVSLLGPDGPFPDTLAGFRTRPSQLQMAELAAACLEDSGIYVVESGTGTGKTLAYLVPALLSGRRVIVSTGTKPLQDQLFHRDLPSVMSALKTPVATALLKGRANYLCLHRFKSAAEQTDLLSGRSLTDLDTVADWEHRTTSGDLNEVAGLAEDAPIRSIITSTSDNCLGASCAHYESCYVNQARREALSADLIVINHHLFCADLVLREDGFGQLLPGTDAVIFDEAHQLAEVASNFLGTSVSSNQIRELCRDTLAEERREQSLVRGLSDVVRGVEMDLSELVSSFPDDGEKKNWSRILETEGCESRLSQVLSGLSDLVDALELAAPAGEGLTRCWQRGLSCVSRLSTFTEPGSSQFVRWADSGKSWFRLHETPLNMGSSLGPYLNDDTKSWFYTSATLSVNGDFGYFCDQLGLEGTQSVSLQSPFDYSRQARLYIPRDLPDPRQAIYLRQLVQRVLPILDITGGRTFFLFTSHSALREAYGLLQECAAFKLLVQGQMPRTELLQRFRSTAGAVLLGTSSFWEGVDVRGQALSCVIIDKLPFESPSDPVLRARLEAIEAAGGNPFMDYQLPHAVIALKQGVGRLIRDSADVGVLMLADPRLITKSYGKIFLNSIPDMPMTREVEDIRDFFNANGPL